MADDLTKRRPQDSTKIHTQEDWEIKYWSEKFGVSRERLFAAVKAVGNSVIAVQKYFGR